MPLRDASIPAGRYRYQTNLENTYRVPLQCRSTTLYRSYVVAQSIPVHCYQANLIELRVLTSSLGADACRMGCCNTYTSRTSSLLSLGVATPPRSCIEASWYIMLSLFDWLDASWLVIILRFPFSWPVNSIILLNKLHRCISPPNYNRLFLLTRCRELNAKSNWCSSSPFIYLF